MHIKIHIRSATLLCIIFSVSMSAYAGALLSDPTEKNVLVVKKQSTPIGTAVTRAGNVTPISNHSDLPQKMSCWQYGKLILEQSAIAPKDKVTDMRLLHNPDTGESMLLFDFKTAFCIIK